jgi:hypothetical protein
MIKKNLVVKNGSYSTRDGQTKHRYLTIGQLHAGNDGNDYITLDSHINLAAIPRKDGDTRVMVSLYDPKPRDGEAPKKAAPAEDDGFGDDIPFN